jgi:hypothetical protein
MTRVAPAGPFLHGFGARYDLPLSLSLYLVGAGSVVLISFMLVATFAAGKVGPDAVRYPRAEIGWLQGVIQASWVKTICGLAGTLYLLAVMATGWLGSAQPESNPAEYLTWIYFWAGLVVLTGVFGPLWNAFNPFAAIDRLITRITGRTESIDPDRLLGVGIWPAAFLYLGFAGFELASGYANRPWLVADLAAAYSIFTIVGMRIYGARSWLSHVEAFTILFSVLSRLAPIQTDKNRIFLRPPGAGLLDRWGTGWDRVVFIILMLSTLAFDGLIATPLWQAIVTDLQPLSQPLEAWGTPGVRGLGLIGVSLLFLTVFALFMRLVMYFGLAEVSPVATTTAFALTLVPIAWVYNLAHNYSYLVIQGQGLFPLLSDPLTRGWHLLPTSGYQPSFAIAQAGTVWDLQVALIVIGHVVAVILAHLRAGERFKTARNALLSQYPMLVLMVMYTMTSLWILAQPSTSG